MLHIRLSRIGPFFAIICISWICFASITTIARQLDTKESIKKQRTLAHVSVFSRHGDRAPSDELAPVDYHFKCLECFWPRGFANLTDLGIYRMTRLGQELRHRYKDRFLVDRRGSLDNYLKAFTSNKTRCIESLDITLSSFLNPEISIRQGLKELAEHKGPDYRLFDVNDLKSIKFDIEKETVLSWNTIQDQCTGGRDIYPASKDLYLDADIRSLPDIDTLAKDLKQHLNVSMDISILATLSNIKNELELERTASTIHYMDPLMGHWMDKPVKNRLNLPITQYDLSVQCPLIFHKNQFTGSARILQVGSILTSIVQGQHGAISGATKTTIASSSHRDEEKISEMRFYNAHDSTVQVLLTAMEIVDFSKPYETRFAKTLTDKGQDEAQWLQFTNGLRLPEYGSTVLFELQLVHYDEARAPLPVIRIFIYNQLDAKRKIEWHEIKIGTICREILFRRGFQVENLYPKEAIDLLDLELDCPMRLFERAYDRYILAEGQQDALCKSTTAYASSKTL